MKKILAVAFLVGCGGDGVSDSKKLSDLSTSEAKDVCLELAGDYPERTVTCTGFSFTVGFTTAECTDQGPEPTTCQATVGDIRDCTDAIYSKTDAQLCMDEALPAACAPLQQGCN